MRELTWEKRKLLTRLNIKISNDASENLFEVAFSFSEARGLVLRFPHSFLFFIEIMLSTRYNTFRNQTSKDMDKYLEEKIRDIEGLANLAS